VAGNLTRTSSTTPANVVTTASATFPAAGSVRPHAITSRQITSPSSTASSSYSYDQAGNLTGSIGTSQNQALTWNDPGQLTQDTVTPAGATTTQNTTYTYDAGGTLLLAADPGITTLYLPDEELSLSTGTGTVTGTRYYSINGTGVATRTGASSIAYLAGDQQGTDSVAIDAATLNVTRRYYDPYGNPRGTAPASFPVGQKGFVGGTADTATGLTSLGARQYQPGTGSFISPDSVLKPYQPWDLNPYSYSKDSPATFSDPTGKDPCDIPKNRNNPACIDEARQQQAEACTGGTAPGQGQYYRNDTPICGPAQHWWEHQPYDVEGLPGQAWNFESDRTTLWELAGVTAGLHVLGFGQAADLLQHYLDGNGTPVQIDPAQMMQDDPLFKAAVQARINQCEARGQTVCNSGWLPFSLDSSNLKLTRGELRWYYELGSWNYRVTGYKDTSGHWHFAVDVFKYYKWGNPYGGPARSDLCVPHIHFPCITQNAIAQLNADGKAQNFDVWGTYDIPDGSG
jgi:RHS repeat-associated protein